SPSTGSEVGGYVVTITGADFRGNPPAVLFGVNDVPAEVITADTDGEVDTVTFTVPPNAPGPVIVRLINDDGQTDSTFFTYVNAQGPPVINAITPDAGGAGTPVTVVGANFDVTGGA